MSDTEMGPVVAETAVTARGNDDPYLKGIADVNLRLDRGKEARLAVTERVKTAEEVLAALEKRIASLESRPVQVTREFTSGANGSVVLTGFASIVSVQPKLVVTGTAADPVVTFGVAATAITKTGFTAAIYRTKGTLLLTRGPVEAVAPSASVTATFIVTGVPA